MGLTLFGSIQGQSAQQGPNQAESDTSRVSGSLYQIVFEPGEPVSGIGAMPAIRLPFRCVDDGTVFISMVQAMGSGSPPSNLSQYSPSLLLTSISRSGEAHSFPLNQVPELYDLQELDDYASQSRVVFLARAARGNPSQQRSSDGNASEPTNKPIEHHFFIIVFDRKGNYLKTMQIEDAFRVTHLALFPSGTFLAYGFDQTDHAPKLAMLKEDATILKFLDFQKGETRSSVLESKDVNREGASLGAAPVQFEGQGQFIYLVQNKTKFPLLEVSEGGAIRAIRPKLPEGVRINMLIPSDKGLYALVSDSLYGAIYELSPQDGEIVRRFSVRDNESAANVACVHDGKFLSFKHSDGRLVPLRGVAEP